MEGSILQINNLKCACIQQQSIRIHQAKVVEMSEEKDTSPTVTGDVNALFSVVDSLSWQKIISDIDYLSSTINKPDLTYLYKLVH